MKSQSSWQLNVLTLLWHEVWQLRGRISEPEKQSTISEPSLGNVRMEQWTNWCKLCFLCNPHRDQIRSRFWMSISASCMEVGVGYLHRIPASSRRRRKGRSRIWDIKMWSRVLRDSDPRMTALAKASRNYKRQTRPLVRESSPHQRPLLLNGLVNNFSQQ
jgi:hypothetical protein